VIDDEHNDDDGMMVSLNMYGNDQFVFCNVL